MFMVGVPLAALYGVIWISTELPRTKDTRTSKLFAPQDVTLPDPPPEHVTGTAYCACAECCGKWATEGGGGITASGHPAEQGVTIAADWSVFPKGTCLIIKGIGRRIVQDTGSAIKGAKLDVFFDSHQEALEFGVKKLRVSQC
jgi:3D (Asp-Asp-Asp) domain-containing protein